MAAGSAGTVMQKLQDLIKDYGKVVSARQDRIATGGTLYTVDIMLSLNYSDPRTYTTPREVRQELYLQAETIIAIVEEHYTLAEQPRIVLESSGHVGDSVEGNMTIQYLGR